MRFISRRRELARLRSLLNSQVNVAVFGKPGNGKTSLLNALVQETDAHTITVPVNPSESGVANSGLAVLVAALRLVDRGVLSRGLEEALDDDGPEAVTAEQIMSVLRRAELDEDYLVIIDGADRLDLRSQTVLGYLLRRLTSGSLRFAISVDTIEPCGAFAGVQTLELRPLELAETIELAQQLYPDLSAEAATVVAFASSGHLLALEHMLELMNERQRAGNAPLLQPVRTSRAVDGLVFDCLGEVSDDTREILKRLAIAPRTSYRPLLKIFPTLFDELGELEARDVVVRSGPHIYIHDQLVRSSVYWSMTASERTALHAQMEQLCQSADQSMVIWHASFVRHQDDGAQQLIVQAQRLVAEGKTDMAVEITERALILCPDAAEIAASLLNLAGALTVHGDFVFARRYIRLARRSVRDASIRLRAARLALEIDFLETQTIPADIANSWTNSDIASNPAEVFALQLELGVCHAERREFAEAEERLAAAGRILERLGARAGKSFESTRLIIEGYRGRGDAALKYYLAFVDTGTAETQVFTAMAAARNLMFTEHYDEARAALGMLELAVPAPSMWHELARLFSIELEIRAGQVHRAAQLLAEARQDTTQHRIRGDLELLLRCWHLLQEGRAVEVEPVEQELMRVAGESSNRSIVARLSVLQGTFLLRHGMPAEALRHLQRCEELGGGGSPNPNLYRHEPELIEALLKVGRREHAVLVLQRFRKRLERCPSRWGELAALRCEALLAAGEKSLELFRRALRASRLTDSDHEKARTIAAFAQRLHELGMRAEGREHMLTAAALYRETGDHRQADALTPDTRPAAEPALVVHPLLSQLSEEERAVVELVREGFRNREIAEKVYVSLRTVEIRLTGVYRKFGVRSRTELIARLSETTYLATG